MSQTKTNSSQTKKMNVLSLTTTAMMTAVLCILAPISIPIGEVPISLATFAVYIAVHLLGTKRGLICVSLYLMLGMVGIPVFAKWSAGVSVLAGPTGGYLLGYLLIVFFTGWFTKLGKGKIPMILIGSLLGTLGCYVVGTLWLGIQLSLSVKAALLAGVIPFIPGDLIKIILSLGITLPIKKQLSTFLDRA